MTCTKSGKRTICQIKGVPLRPYAYDKGRKYCSRCTATFDTESRICPCCSQPLRTKPRGRKGKNDLNKRNGNEPTRF